MLVAHRLEAAYFYPPDAPKIAAISLGNPLGMMSATTIGYTVGAALLWFVGPDRDGLGLRSGPRATCSSGSMPCR